MRCFCRRPGEKDSGGWRKRAYQPERGRRVDLRPAQVETGKEIDANSEVVSHISIDGAFVAALDHYTGGDRTIIWT